MPLLSPKNEIVLERVLNLIDRRETAGRAITQTQIAGAIGVSPAVISHFLKRSYDGDVDKIAQLLKSYVEREEAKDEGGLLRIPFVETRPAKAGLSAIKSCHRYGRMGAVLAGSGSGKTSTIRQASKEDPSLIVITAWARLGAIGVQQELCEVLRVGERGNSRALMKRLRNKLADKGRCIVVDDAHTLAFGALDTLRYIYDQTGCGMVLVGIPALARHLSSRSEEYEQLASRVASRVYELPEFSSDDARLMLEAGARAEDIEASMSLLSGDPQTVASGRRLGSILEDAGKFAKMRGANRIAFEDIKKAVRLAA